MYQAFGTMNYWLLFSNRTNLGRLSFFTLELRCVLALLLVAYLLSVFSVVLSSTLIVFFLAKHSPFKQSRNRMVQQMQHSLSYRGIFVACKPCASVLVMVNSKDVL
ncbi:hypothetical protein IW262DRAFT_13817 [Armillaria fumosa]|nr:hypothetical protein IW262DRAFT_13817 [Armillaria fumosa]